MVNIVVNYQNYSIVQVTIAGHANFDVVGKDIVCAGISVVVIGTCNALHEMVTNEITISHVPSLITIKVTTITNTNQVILQTMLWQLKTINNQYPQYLKIKEV